MTLWGRVPDPPALADAERTREHIRGVATGGSGTRPYFFTYRL